MKQKTTKKTGQLVHFISLGCPRNLVDTEVMIGLVTQHGFIPTLDLEKADYIVINTCGFLQASRQESLETIQYALANKKSSAKVIAAGCMVQLQPKELESCDIHYLLGSGDIGQILHAISATERGKEISSARSFLEKGDVPRTLSTPPHYAYLKIAEGCRKRCSYCIIPQIKGPLRSKPEEQVLQEFESLLDRGVEEVILIAQDLGDWGKDLGFTASSGLVHLLQKMLNVPREFHLRLLYVYPDEVTSELASLMASDSRILPYLDMPIQHCHNDILKMMRRATSREQIIEKMNLLREKVPNISLRTSIILGFPGETDEHFADLCRFIQEHPFDHLGIFSYSREELSDSYNLPSHVPEEIKAKRSQELGQIQHKLVTERNQKMIGKKMDVTIDSFHSETQHLLIGRHAGQCPEVDSVIFINDFAGVQSFGKRYLVEITDVSDYDLVGKVLPNPS